MNEPNYLAAAAFLRRVRAWRIEQENPPVVELSDVERAHLALDEQGAPRQVNGKELALEERVLALFVQSMQPEHVS